MFNVDKYVRDQETGFNEKVKDFDGFRVIKRLHDVYGIEESVTKLVLRELASEFQENEKLENILYTHTKACLRAVEAKDLDCQEAVELYERYKDFVEIPIDTEDCITVPFWFYPAGTNKADILSQFDEEANRLKGETTWQV